MRLKLKKINWSQGSISWSFFAPYALAPNFCASNKLLKSRAQGPKVEHRGVKMFMKSTPVDHKCYLSNIFWLHVKWSRLNKWILNIQKFGLFDGILFFNIWIPTFKKSRFNRIPVQYWAFNFSWVGLETTTQTTTWCQFHKAKPPNFVLQNAKIFIAFSLFNFIKPLMPKFSQHNAKKWRHFQSSISKQEFGFKNAKMGNKNA